MLIRPTLASDLPAIAAMLDKSFGPARHQRTAALVRKGAEPIAEASYVAESRGIVVGSVAVHRILWVSDRGYSQPLAWLGPLVSHPDHRGQGIGIELMDSALTSIDRLDLAVALVGDAPYYARWGFSSDATGRWAMPGPVDPARLLLRAATPDAFAGPAMVLARAPAAMAA